MMMTNRQYTLETWGATEEQARRNFTIRSDGLHPTEVVAHPVGGFIAKGNRSETLTSAMPENWNASWGRPAPESR
jgi:hypothetical protein